MLKDFFLPTPDNDMTPIVLSREAFVFYLVLGIALLVGPSYLRGRQFALVADQPSISPSQMVSLVNQSRAANGLPALFPEDALSRAAEAKLKDMIDRQYFDHFAPGDRKAPWDFIREQGYAYAAAGENLAQDFVTAQDAETAFMGSPTHRANILNPLFTQVGIAVAQGKLQGRTTILIAQYFAKPRISGGVPTRAIAAPQPAPAPKPVVKKPVPKPSVTPTVTTTVSSAVAGVSQADQAPSLPAVVAPSVDWATLFKNPQVPLKTAVGFAIAAICVALALMILRGALVSGEIVLRSVAVIAVLGYVLFSQDFVATVARLTPTAASVSETLEHFSR